VRPQQKSLYLIHTHELGFVFSQKYFDLKVWRVKRLPAVLGALGWSIKLNINTFHWQLPHYKFIDWLAITTI
jgi:hypothetical protein